jgi:hypothetical protein
MGIVNSQTTRYKLVDFILSVIIILVLFAPWVYSNLLLHPLFYQNYDPEIPYFMNSLMAFKGQTYYYVDHPGTPLEIIGSFILALTYPFISGGLNNFILYHLQNPDLFLTFAHLFVTVASIVCALYIKKLLLASSQRWDDIMIMLALPLMFYIMHPMSFETLDLWSHTSFNFPFGTLLLFVFYKIAKTQHELTTKNIIALGLFAGILTSVMIYFSAWIVGFVTFIIVWYRIQKAPWRKILLQVLFFVLFGMVGFLLMLIPSIQRFSYFFNWMIQLIFHEGTYGGGPEGITTIPLMALNLSSLYQAEPFLLILSSIFAIIFVFLLIWKRRNLGERGGLWAFGTGVLIQMVVVLLLVLKHPMDRYLLSLAAILPAFAMVILQILDYVPRFRRIFIWAMALLVFILLPAAFQKSFDEQYNTVQRTRNIAAQNERIINDYTKIASKDQVLILWTYGSYSPCYALQFGNEYTGFGFTKELSTICKNQYQFNIWTRMAYISASKRPLDNLKWDIILTSGNIFHSYTYLGDYGIFKEYPDDVVAIYKNR